MKAATKTTKPIPVPRSWLFFSYGDASPAIGGGVGAFHWFKTRRGMLDYVSNWLAFENPGPSSSDPEKVLVRVKKVLAGSKGSAALESTRKKLNKALKGYSQIQWWGTFSQLCSGNETFPSQVRGAFFRSDESLPKAAPVPTVQRKEFISFLSEYGL